MQRVHSDLPARPLPMLRPDAPPTVENGIVPAGTPGAPTTAPAGEDTLMGVLRSILGIPSE